MIAADKRPLHGVELIDDELKIRPNVALYLAIREARTDLMRVIYIASEGCPALEPERVSGAPGKRHCDRRMIL